MSQALDHPLRQPVLDRPAQGPADRPVSSLPLWLLIAGLTFNLFSGHADELGLPVNLDRLLLPAAMLFVVLEPGRRRWPRATVFWVFAVFAIMATWSALSHGVEADPTAAFALLDRVYLPLALCFFAPNLLTRDRDRRIFLWFLTFVALYLAWTTLAQFAGAWALVWPPYARVPAEGSSFRSAGPFMNSEVNGLSLIMCGAAAAALAGMVRGPRQLIPLAGAAAALGSCVLTMTRSVWLAAVLAVLGFVACRRTLLRWWWVAMVALVAAVLAAVVLAPELVASVMTRSTESSSVYDREATNAAALKIMAEQPLTGVGWRQFVDVGWDWVRQGDTSPMAHTHIEIHNVFLARAAELGIPAAITFVVALAVGPIGPLFRRRDGELAHWRAFAVAASAAWFAPAMLSPNPHPFPNFVLWLAGGALLLEGTSRGRVGGSGQGRVARVPAGEAGAAGTPT
ncbi:MAG: O-antigen ligase family protein [Austwickia sp.]|nr:O-antigen ligase family protein [Austwickia sp.]